VKHYARTRRSRPANKIAPSVVPSGVHQRAAQPIRVVSINTVFPKKIPVFRLVKGIVEITKVVNAQIAHPIRFATKVISVYRNQNQK
jgi:hypothetical protein